MDKARDTSGPAVGVFVQKSALRLVLESTARHALRSEEVVGSAARPKAGSEDEGQWRGQGRGQASVVKVRADSEGRSKGGQVKPRWARRVREARPRAVAREKLRVGKHGEGEGRWRWQEQAARGQWISGETALECDDTVCHVGDAINFVERVGTVFANVW